MRVIVVLVKPIHEINVGSAARAMKNFGQNELRLVAPRARIGFETKLYAKHSYEIIKKAKTKKTLSDAIKDCDLVIGTTGVPSRYRDSAFKNCVSLREAVKKAVASKAKKIALVFGPEDSGLSAGEFNECGIVAFIPASARHRVLNLSHAVAVCLYEFFSATREGREKIFFRKASKKKTLALARLFAERMRKNPGVRDKRKVALAFERVLARAPASDDEVQALFAAFSERGKRRAGETSGRGGAK